MSLLMGIDLGTSSIKTIVMTQDGEILSIANRTYEINSPHLGWAEQDPEEWWRCTLDCISELFSTKQFSSEDIAGIGFSGQMHGTVLLGKDNRLLRPAIIWCDQRTRQEVDDINIIIGRDKLGKHTMSAASCGFQFPVLLWIKRNEPDIYDSIDKVILPKDYIRFRLTGEVASEITDASGTALYDTVNRTWSYPIIKQIGLKPEIFPTVGNPHEVAGFVTAGAAEESGLYKGTLVAFGGGDQQMHSIGNGLVDTGVTGINIGTGGQVCTTSPTPEYDKMLRIHTFASAVPNKWNIMGALLNAGLSLKWLANQIIECSDFSMINEKAVKIRPGSEGLLFLPYLSGVRTPYMDSEARGVFLGLTLQHDRFHLVRSVMEGVAFALKETIDVFNEINVKADTMLASGGGAKSSLWLSILANVFGSEIKTVAVTEQACLGAAIIAGVAGGVYTSVSDGCIQAVRYDDNVVEPDPVNIRIYSDYYDAYKQIYLRNKELLHDISALQTR